MEPQHDNSGIFFKNDRKSTDNQPDYTGYCTIAGVQYYLSCWVKQGAKGAFMTLSFTNKAEADAKRAEATTRVVEPTTPVDIPF